MLAGQRLYAGYSGHRPIRQKEESERTQKQGAGQNKGKIKKLPAGSFFLWQFKQNRRE